MGLHQGQRLEQLVEGAEAAGQHDEALGVLHEHRLAGEEVAEVDADVDPLVEPGLEGQLDAEPDADAAGLAGALVGRLHRARAAAGDDREAGLDQRAGRPARPAAYVGCVGRGARRAEDARSPGPSSASAPKPSTNSAWIRSTRHGSVCTQSWGRGSRAAAGRWCWLVDLVAALEDRALELVVMRVIAVASEPGPQLPLAALDVLDRHVLLLLVGEHRVAGAEVDRRDAEAR